ncbi:MAG: LuxR C-terminal-related transcriptional regulator [Pseudomonadota bacterium]
MAVSRPTLLWGIFLIQITCTFFFVADMLPDLFGWPDATPGTPADSVPATGLERGDLMEIAVTVSLLLGTLFSGWELRKSLRRESRMQHQIDKASGAFADLLQSQFDVWGLTEAERAVALMGIKGYSISEIASIRETKEGTIKAQNASIYRKAGVSGRVQLLSHFVEDLLHDSLIPKDTPPPKT